MLNYMIYTLIIKSECLAHLLFSKDQLNRICCSTLLIYFKLLKNGLMLKIKKWSGCTRVLEQRIKICKGLWINCISIWLLLTKYQILSRRLRNFMWIVSKKKCFTFAHSCCLKNFITREQKY